MRNQTLFSLVLTLIFYAFVAYLIIAFLITALPFLALFLLLFFAVIAVSWVIRTIRSQIHKAVNPPPEFDENGSRKTSATVLEMKDTETPKDPGSNL